jgi:hypothetical protein
MQVHEIAFTATIEEVFTPGINQAAPSGRPVPSNSASRDQITGFQAIGTSRYFVPSFSTCPIEGKVKWNPTTIAFSADAMS